MSEVLGKAKRQPQLSREALYQLIKDPVITEKSTRITEHGQYVFRVSLDAKKPEIKQAVETLFNVQVVGVNTMVQKGKVKRFRGRVGKRSDVKKAFVQLAPGQQIDFTTGLG